MLKLLIIFLLAFAATFEVTAPPSSQSTHGIKALVVDYFNKQTGEFANSANDLYLAIKSIHAHDKLSLQKAKTALVHCRVRYKRFSFFLNYFFPQQAWIYNAPSKYEVEEPFMEWEEPHGLQFIEEMLFSPDVFSKKSLLEAQARVIQESARDLKNLLYQFSFTDAQLFESLHLELIRIMSLYIAGYDAPYLKSGLWESIESMTAVKYVVSVYSPKESKNEVIELFDPAIAYLKTDPDFDSFNRLDFIADFALPMERKLSAFIQKNDLTDSSSSQQHPAFSSFIWDSTHGVESSDKITQLGKKLFSDKILSGDFSRACSSCHQPEKYFTDGLKTNFSLDGKTPLFRNTPTLFYAANQRAQFWDGRATSLEEQVLDVLANPKEMNAELAMLALRLNKDINYKKYFNDAFDRKTSDSINLDQVSTAIAKFVKTLAQMNADFDHYMNGNKNALSPDQKRGFNLFMGKAQCGTCHFIPLFNGSTPPGYNRTEYEVIGVPATNHFEKPVKDQDSGRFDYFPAPFYRGAFKTPTLRNIEKTGPYMHNGSFRSLAEVLDFYNRGGGRGLGMDIPNQTLSEKPLHLTKTEMDDIILFLNSLTDHPISSPMARLLK